MQSATLTASARTIGRTAPPDNEYRVEPTIMPIRYCLFARKSSEDDERFSRFASDVLGVGDKQKAQKINQRKYVEYLLRNGTITEKRELMGCLKNRLLIKEQKNILDDEKEAA